MEYFRDLNYVKDLDKIGISRIDSKQVLKYKVKDTFIQISLIGLIFTIVMVIVLHGIVRNSATVYTFIDLKTIFITEGILIVLTVITQLRTLIYIYRK